MIAQGGWFFPQLFTANTVEHLPRMKPVIVNAGFFLERLPFWVIAFSALIAGTSPHVAVVLFLIAYAWHTFGSGVAATAWQDLIARCFPVDRRGRFFGFANFLGTGMGIVGAGISARLLKSTAFPINFVYIFLLAAIFNTLSWLFVSLTREPTQATTKPTHSDRDFWRQLPDILRQDGNFRRFLIARLLMGLGSMGSSFLAVAAIQKWQVPDSTIGLYTGAMLIGQTAANLLFGFLADRFGHKLSLVIGSLFAVLTFVLAWWAASPAWYFVVFALRGVSIGAVIVSGLLLVMEFSIPERRPTYVGLANTGIGLVNGIAPLLGTGLATLGYSQLFAISAFAHLIALGLLIWWVKEPRQRESQ
jgi:MFS family permease